MMDQTQLAQTWDVLVAGGGPGGVNAAVAAARHGASVLLVERYGYLGGMATAGLINPFMAYTIQTTGQVLTTGVFNEILSRLEEHGGLAQDRVTFDDEQMKLVLDELCVDAGVNVLLHSFVGGADVNGGVIQSIRLTGKSGAMNLRARIFVDSTGDGDLAALAGCHLEVGRAEDGLCQPMTLCFRVAGVDMAAYAGEEFYHWDHPLRLEIDRVYQDAKTRGAITNPREDVLIFTTLRPDVLHFNTTRIIRHSALDVLSLTNAEQIARRQVVEMVDLLKSQLPAFRNAYLQKMAAHIGVRESRRVMGQYVLTAEDILAGVKFADGIARSVYPVDIHNPAGTGTVLKHLPPGEYYEIPFRCLVPLGCRNLLVGSRCISATHEAHSSLRVMPVVAGIGEAAGIAAALSAQRGISPESLDGKEIRKAIGI
jgi:FAD dependent oxidoreductase